jgi:hypothetical protein
MAPAPCTRLRRNIGFEYWNDFIHKTDRSMSPTRQQGSALASASGYVIVVDRDGRQKRLQTSGEFPTRSAIFAKSMRKATSQYPP